MRAAVDSFCLAYNIDKQFIRQNYKCMEPWEALIHCDHELRYPLLINDKDTYFKCQNGFLLIPEIRRRLDIINELEYHFCNGMLWGDGVEAEYNDLKIFAGMPMLSLFKNDVFVMDYATYGFTDFDEFLFVMSAHIENMDEGNHCYSSFSWETDVSGKRYCNQFSRYIHGDFRFTQFDVTNKKVLSPFGDHTSVYKPTEKTISAYHSVECMFFAIVLRYAIQLGIKLPVMDDYKAMIEGILREGCNLGNFADAGHKSFYSESFLLTVPIPEKGGSDVRNPHSMPKEHEGEERAFVENGNLVFLPSRVTFSGSDANNLIIALHKACQHGYGRTTIGNLVQLHAKMAEQYHQKFPDFFTI
jgi:hypothetical protein